MNNLNIREYKTSDKKTIVDFYEGFTHFFEPFDPWDKKDKDVKKIVNYYSQKMFKNVKKHAGKIYLAETENKTIGFIAFYSTDQTREDAMSEFPMKMGYIDALFISDSYRDMGIGEKLIKTAEKYFKEKGRDHSELHVFGPNIRAHNFYIKHGYVNKEIKMRKTL